LTCEAADFQLSDLFSINPGFLNDYFEFAKQILVLHDSDLNAPTNKLPSLTATVTYHSLKQHFGIHRTYVPWEPENADGQKGVRVDPSHCWMYFFDASKIEQLKRQLNHKNTTKP